VDIMELIKELRKILKQKLEEKKLFDLLDMNTFSFTDIEVCNYVSSQIPFIDVDGVYVGKNISLEELREKSLEELKLFDSLVVSRASSILSETPIVMSEGTEVFEFGTMVSYDHLDDGRIVADSGTISKYIIPNELSEFSILNFTHEQLHGLKETNYNEYLDNRVLGETIPLFYELVTNGLNENLKKELLKFRLQVLWGDKEEYKIFNYLYESTGFFDIFVSNNGDITTKKSLYEYIRSLRSCYLNSFYYAVILYNMYKVNPQKILNLVSMVLKHEMTTLQLLQCLDVYGDVRGEIFEKEMCNIKRLIK